MGQQVDQVAASREAIASVQGFLGGPFQDGDDWVFEFGEHLESNWGAVYGGALAAGTLAIARAVAPERSPRSLHIQIVRSVPRGAAFATAKMRHAGRTVGTVEVDLYDARRKLAAIALVTMVTPAALAADLHDTRVSPGFRLLQSPVDPTLISYQAPITQVLNLVTEDDGAQVQLHVENARSNVDGTMSPGMKCSVPWKQLAWTGPEAACLVADAMVAAPVLQSFVPLESLGPNADLTLRFSTAPAAPVIEAAATMVSVQHGSATVTIEVHAGDQQLAHGLATSLLLAPA